MAFPEIVTKDLFKKAFQIHFNNKDVRILEYTTKCAVPPGDNFTSDLLRCVVTYQIGENVNNKFMSVLVKISPETNEALVGTVRELKLFQKEIEMYTKILPQVDQILGHSGVLSPICIYAEEYPIPLLIIQDLSPLGYKMQDRRKGLDLDHCLIVIKKIAQLHAASIIIYNKDQSAFANFNNALYSEHPFIVNWVHTGLDWFAKVCKERPGMEKYQTKLERIKENLFEKLANAIKSKPGDISVLNHGDCWLNNFMFLYDDDGKLLDVKLVDYQMGVYSGVGLDLQYFWSTSPNTAVFREQFDTILNCYYDELVLTLTRLEYPRDKLPKKLDVSKDFISKAIYGLAAAVSTLAIIKCDSRDDARVEEILRPMDNYEGSFCEHVHTNPLVWEFLKQVLPFLDKLGAFE